MPLPFQCTPHGRPIIPQTPAGAYGFGHLIRLTEEMLLRYFDEGQVVGTLHTCLGQELCQMAVARTLTHPQDFILSNHRNHGHFLTFTGQFLALTAEILGRQGGVCGGFGGSQHLVWERFYANGVQGGMTAIGVGMALASRLAKEETGMGVVFIGDGTLGEGLLYESLNLAALWQLPLLFVVENNGIAQTTPTAAAVAGDILLRGEAFGLKSWRLNDADPELFRQAQQVTDWVRRLRQPGFMMVETARMGPHSKGDDLRDMRERAAIQDRDPLMAMGRLLPKAMRDHLEKANRGYLSQIRQEVLALPVAIPQGELSPPLAMGFPKPIKRPSPVTTVRECLNHALETLLAKEPRSLLLGEDIHAPYGGAFKVTGDLSLRYPERVISTPISEAGVVGAAIGLALAGFRPVVEIMFADFLTLAADQIVNHAVKLAVSNREGSLPLVIRTPSGGGRGYGPTHSQSLENIFVSVPGLTVIFPSHRHRVGDLLLQSAQGEHGPILFFEHKLLYGLPCDPGAYVELPSTPGENYPTLVRPCAAPDITLLTYGGMLPVVEQAAEQLRAEELEVEIVVPSLLSPLPISMIQMLLDRRALVVVEETHLPFGVGAEILARLMEAGYTGRAIRVGAKPVPIPAAPALERSVLPQVADVVHAATQIIF